jgi:Jacalin-like lectin domain
MRIRRYSRPLICLTVPFSTPQGKEFQNRQMIVGFFGRAGDNLDAIGVLYAPCTAVRKGGL